MPFEYYVHVADTITTQPLSFWYYKPNYSDHFARVGCDSFGQLVSVCLAGAQGGEAA